MKKVCLIPLILSLSLPIAGCSFSDLMFWKKKSDTPAQTEKTVTGISAVHAPQTIEQNATLDPSNVDLDITYSDSSTGSVKAERVSLVTSTLGETTGTAFYGQFYKDFAITVVAPSQKTITEITEVHAPQTIEQNATLPLTSVTLDVRYSDGTTDSVNPERIMLSTEILGEITGYVFVGNVYKDFTITVISSSIVRPVEILSVTAPEEIFQGKTLLCSQVNLSVKLSNGETFVDEPDSIDLNTNTPGEAVEGTVHYADLTKEFTIRVLANKVESITAVHAPSSIGQGESLLPSNVTVDVKYSDNSTATYVSTNVVLDTSVAGSVQGTAYYGEISHTFTISVISEEQSKSYTELKNGIVNDHNYTIDVVSYYENFPEERYDGVMYNLNDKVFYGTDPEYPNLFLRGYSTVKDQGIVEFVKGLSSDEVVIQNFIATNPELTIYDIHAFLPEYILESELTLVEANHYRTSNQELVSMVAQYSNLELSYISNPEHIDIYKIGNTIKIVSVLTANYYDPETLDPVENEPVYVGLTIRNIGFTSDTVLENFSTSESSKVATPTEWDEELTSDFNDHYNGYIPPFISGLSYSFHHATQWNGLRQKYVIMGEDFNCGDKRTAYAEVLSGEGFSPLEDGTYEKRVSNEGGTIDQVYRVEMNYISPSVSYGDKTIGYYFVGGVFQIAFLTYTEVTAPVSDVESLNTYIDATAASELMPRFPSAFNSVEVTGFDDRTEINNQLYGGGFIFATSLTSYFKIKVSSYSDAQSFYAAFKTAANAKGYTKEETNPILCTTTFSDEGNSYIELSRPESFGSSNYPGYLQCRICIREYTATYEVEFDKDEGVGTVSPSYFADVEPGEKVTFSFAVKEGYELDEVACNKEGVEITKESGENTYSFIMPASDVVVIITTNSSAASEGLVYDYAYTTYVRADGSSLEEFDEAPSGKAYSKLTLTFNEDGTGQYKRVKYNSSGAEIAGGTYTVNFTYTLVSGKLTVMYVSGDNTGFDKWRLFDAGTAGRGNDGGSFSENKITMTVYDSNVNPTTIHFA